MKKQNVWTVSQDGGKTVAGAYAGKDAKRKAAHESGGKTKAMTADEFRAVYPNFEIVTLTMKNEIESPIAESLGITEEQLRADYDAAARRERGSILVKAARRFWRLYLHATPGSRDQHEFKMESRKCIIRAGRVLYGEEIES